MKNFMSYSSAFRLIGGTSLCLIMLHYNGSSFYSSATKQPEKPQVEIRGIYGSPAPFWDLGYRLDELNINGVFVHSFSLSEEMIQRSRREGANIYAEFPTLNGKQYITGRPEAWAIDEFGERVEPASWFMGVCPTEPGFKSFRMNELKELLGSYDIDGVWMDYVHFHAQFEEPEPILVETCFCEHCLKAFQLNTGIKINGQTTNDKAQWIFQNAGKTWRDWRCEVIDGWAREMRQIIDREKPGALLGIYHCPWTDSEYDGARRKYLGLDYELLSKSVDVFSPMVYHNRMGRDADWVEENIQWFVRKIESFGDDDVKVWPIVQAYNNPMVISSEEFGTVLQGAISGGGTGVMMFTSRAVAEDSAKTLKMQSIYKSWVVD